MSQSKDNKFAKALPQSGWPGKIKVYVQLLGPGLIAGASDDDPSGIGTYAQTGAQFGYAQLWTALFTFPLMTAVQEMCARVALHTGRGLADIIREHYPKPLLYVCVLLLFTANTINLGADLGTTISPYLFFWQASEEVEEDIDQGKTTPAARQGVSTTELRWMRTDVTSGMLFANLVMWFIIVTTAATLFRHGITDIDSAPKAAEALHPIAGRFASVLFAAGIVGTGLLAVPILAGSAAYAVAETFKWREGLYLQLRQEPGFYGVIAFSTDIGAAINFVGINPIKALYYTGVINGLVAPLLLWIILLMSNNRTIMQENVNRRVANILGWVTTLAMTMAAGALLVTYSTGR